MLNNFHNCKIIFNIVSQSLIKINTMETQIKINANNSAQNGIKPTPHPWEIIKTETSIFLMGDPKRRILGRSLTAICELLPHITDDHAANAWALDMAAIQAAPEMLTALTTLIENLRGVYYLMNSKEGKRLNRSILQASTIVKKANTPIRY